MDATLVIGGGGFIGLHTVRRLADAGHAVWATYSPHRPAPAANGVRWLPCDLTDLDATKSWPRSCRSIIYLAQSRNWRRFPEAADDVFAVNIAGLLKTMSFALAVGVNRCIVATTGSVYTDLRQPAREADAIDLHASRQFYVATKLAGEILLGPYGSLLPVVLLRLFMPYGAGMNRDMLFPQLVTRIRERRPITLHGQDGLRANPVDVTDVAEVLRRCLALVRTLSLNVAGPEELTLRDIGRHLGRTLGIEPAFESNLQQQAPVIVGDTTALRAALDWQPETRFSVGVQRWLGDDVPEQGRIPFWAA